MANDLKLFFQKGDIFSFLFSLFQEGYTSYMHVWFASSFTFFPLKDKRTSIHVPTDQKQAII